METLTKSEKQLLAALGPRLALPPAERRRTLQVLLQTLADAMAGTALPDDPLLRAYFVATDPPGPALLGALLEHYAGERHASGSYYTPRPLVQFMSRLALFTVLELRLPAEAPPAIATFLQRRDPGALHAPTATLAVLRELRICDPACGGGAYLAGMAGELAALQQALCRRIGQACDPGATLRRVVERNLFGSDIDPLVISGCGRRLGLLAGTANAGTAGNLRCADSLAAAPNTQSGWPAGFDIVITNPPYLSCKHGFGRSSRAELSRRFRSAHGQFDAWMLFLERGLELLLPGGCYAYLVPRPLLANRNSHTLRELLAEQRIVALADPGPIFAAGVEPMVVVGQHTTQNGRPVQIFDPPAVRRGQPVLLRAADSFVNSVGIWNIGLSRLSAGDSQRLLDLPRLGELCRLLRGAECGKHDPAISDQPGADAYPLLRGADVQRYRIAYAGLFIRRQGSARRYKPLAVQQAPKLLVRRVAGEIIAALDDSGRHGLNTLYIILPHDDYEWLPAYLCGLLNSQLLNDYFAACFQHHDRLFPYLRMEQLAAMPIALAAPPLRRRIVGLVQQLHQADDAPVRAHLDELVYRAYGSKEKKGK
jgi:hypothetical protein